MRNVSRKQDFNILIWHESYRFQLVFYFPTNQHEFNLHARSRARNIHHCRRGKGRKSKIKRRNKEKEKKTRIKSTNVFIHRSNETRANFQLDFLFRFEYKSLRICSPLFRLLLLYVPPSKRRKIFNGETLLSRGDRRENDRDNEHEHAVLRLIHPLCGWSLFLWWIIEYHVS